MNDDVVAKTYKETAKHNIMALCVMIDEIVPQCLKPKSTIPIYILHHLKGFIYQNEHSVVIHSPLCCFKISNIVFFLLEITKSCLR